MDRLLLLIPLLPFLGFLANGLGGKRLRPSAVSLIGCVAPFASFVLSCVLFVALGDGSGVVFRQTVFRWIEVAGTRPEASLLSAPFAFLFDPLAALMCLVVTGVGSLIHLYATRYMRGDPGYARFFAYLNLFTAFMLVLVLADNLLLLFIGWEGVGLCSYLLIGFWYTERANASAGMKAFVVNRIGDFGVLLAMFLILMAFGTLDMTRINELAPNLAQHAATLPGGTIALGLGAAGMLTAITLLLFLGCTGKSAQIPLYTWLPDAMAGPTPVSALIHAATMVTSGVYLCCRLHPLFTAAAESTGLATGLSFVVHTNHLIMGVGAATALLAALIAISQNDIKRVLAYSTVSQLGYMFFAVGLGAYSAAFFHVVTHAFFKALLFLGSGSVILAMHHEQDMRRMGGLGRRLPITHATFLIGAAALTGFPLLSGFISKDEILFMGFTENRAFWFVAWLTAGLTALYMWRVMALTFWGESRVSEKLAPEVREPGGWIPFVLIVLAALSLAGGLLNWPAFLFGGKSWVTHFTNLPHAPGAAMHAEHVAEAHGAEWTSLVLSIAMAFAGFLAGAWLYGPGRASLARFVEGPGRTLARWSQNKFYVDELYDRIIVRPFEALSAGLFRVIDRWLIDEGLVEGIGHFVRWLGGTMRVVQSGFTPQYVATYTLGALALVIFVLHLLRKAA